MARSAVRPLFRRRPRRFWSGLLLGGLVGTVLTVLVVVLGAGIMTQGNPLALLTLKSLGWASASLLVSALVGGGLVAGVLVKIRHRTRCTPLRTIPAFLAPLLLAAVSAVIGFPYFMAQYGMLLVPVFALQALLCWLGFLFFGYPPYKVSRAQAEDNLETEFAQSQWDESSRP